MKTKTNRKIKVVTLGCSKNTVDSEVLMGKFKANGQTIIPDFSEALGDTVIINTCGFINDAKQESIDTILNYVEAKKNGKLKEVVVMGCLSERYKETLLKEIPEIDAIFGVNEQTNILKTFGVDYKSELVGERLLTTPSHFAYMKISEGCDRQCSFCAIPLIRGKHISRPQEYLLEEAKSLTSKGVKEIILIAQDLTYYGLDIYKKRKLPELVSKLTEIEGLEWLRLHYTYPTGFPLELLDVIANNEKVCNYIDIPVQHISNTILASMKRNITSTQTLNLLDKIKSILPDAAIRTTLITGYPGESDNDFRELKDFIKTFKFDRLGIFTYSHEEDTPAFKLNDDIPEEVKQQRAAEIMEIQEEISLEKNRAKIGKTYKVIIDRIEAGYYIGRTQYDSPEVDNEVLIPTSNDKILEIGKFYQVHITDAESFDLFGVVKNL